MELVYLSLDLFQATIYIERMKHATLIGLITLLKQFYRKI